MSYDIDKDFELIIGGTDTTETKPFYIKLQSKINPDNSIDIRTENVKKFIEENQN